jgi:threonine dehydrogenase-like Zn-dependent dehydrogenase
MRAAVCTGPQRVAVETLPCPEPGPGELRVRVRACGICGSDLHLLPIGYLGPRVTPGHEVAGEVDAIGPGVDGLEPGTAVAVEPLDSCGHCPSCQEGRDAICREGQVFGIHRAGGLAEYLTVPARRAFPLPTGLDAAVGALAEPLAVVVHGLRRARLQPGQRVLVIGAGTLGVLTALAARELGADDVWLTARYEHQAALAAQLGATHVLREAEASVLELDRLGREMPIDCAVETVGGEADTLLPAVAALRPGGTVSVLGLFAGPLSLDPVQLLLKELTLAWSNCYEHPHSGADFETATRIIDAHRTSLAGVVTHRVALDEVERAFTVAADKSAGAVKVTVLI